MAVVQASVATTWVEAVGEWEVAGYSAADSVDDLDGVECICGHERLKHLYTIANPLSGNVLFPIGSICIHRFGRSDLDRSVIVEREYFNLRRGLLEDKDLLEPEYFKPYLSVKLIEVLGSRGVYDLKACEFLLKMRRKHSLDSISDRQWAYIEGLLGKISRYVLLNESLP